MLLEPIFVAPVRFASSKAKGGKKAGKVVKDTKETQNVMFEEKIDFVAERWITDDPARHCKFVCINYEAESMFLSV
jgi:hypothetical protein